jgi:hypothetical protein
VIYNVIANNRSNLIVDGRRSPRRGRLSVPRAMDVADGVHLHRRRQDQEALDRGGAPRRSNSPRRCRSRARLQARVHDFDSRSRAGARHHAPVISPDGTQVAFARSAILWLMPIRRHAQKLTNDRFVEMDPTWSPDGDRSRSRRIATARWTLGRDIASGADRKSRPRRPKASWAPRGTEIAYINRDGALAITGRSAPVHATFDDRAGRRGRPRLDRGDDAAAVLDAFPRGHQPADHGVDHGRRRDGSIRSRITRSARASTTARCGRATARRWRS